MNKYLKRKTIKALSALTVAVMLGITLIPAQLYTSVFNADASSNNNKKNSESLIVKELSRESASKITNIEKVESSTKEGELLQEYYDEYGAYALNCEESTIQMYFYGSDDDLSDFDLENYDDSNIIFKIYSNSGATRRYSQAFDNFTLDELMKSSMGINQYMKSLKVPKSEKDASYDLVISIENTKISKNVDTIKYSCNSETQTSGFFDFSAIRSSNTDELYAYVTGGHPNSYGDLHLDINGETSVESNWAHTDNLGNYSSPAWRMPSTDETTTAYIEWADGTITTTDNHVWDVTEPNIDILEINYGNSGFTGNADDGKYGTGFDLGIAGWSNSEVKFKDETSGLYYSLVTGGYTEPTPPSLGARTNPSYYSRTFDWEADAPTEEMHECDHTYTWTYLTNDYFYYTSKSETFTYECQNNTPPECTLSANPPSGTAPLNVTFNASKSDADGDNVTFESLKYGYLSEYTNYPSFPLGYLYPTADTYTATLTVKDSQGAQGTCTTLIHVSDNINHPPTCTLYANPTNGEAPLHTRFTALISDPDSGDHAHATLLKTDYNNVEFTNPAFPMLYTYNDSGIYFPELTVVDEHGLTATCTRRIVVSTPQNQPPTACFNMNPEKGYAPLDVNFNANCSTDSDGTISTYNWDFGDGSTGTGITPMHTFTTAGSYNVTLTVTDNDGLTDSVAHSIVVYTNHEPVCTLIATPSNGNSPLNVEFTATMNDTDYNQTATPVTLNYGNGDSDSSPSFPLDYTYNSDGTYTAELTVEDNLGLQGTCTTDVSVEQQLFPPNACFTATPDTGHAPLDVNFNANCSTDTDGTIVSYSWDFNDGTTGSGITPSHTYTNAGTFNPVLTVTDNDGLTDTFTLPVTVEPNLPPECTLTAVPDTGTAPHSLQFQATVTDPEGDSVTSVVLEYGDGNSLNSPTFPSPYTYVNTGVYDAVLVVRDDYGKEAKCSDSVTVTTNNPPIAVINATPQTGIEPLDVHFDGSGSYDPDGDPIINYAWDFGDTNLDTGPIVNHTYVNTGVYTATLTVTDNKGDSGTAFVVINVTPNRAPLVDADILTANNVRNNVPVGNVQLNGSAFDPDGDTLLLNWTQTAGSQAVTLNNSTTLTPDFNGNAGEWYVFELCADDQNGHTVCDTVVINMEQANGIPWVDADVFTSDNIRTDVSAGTVQLEASAIDPDGDTLAFSWTLTDGTSSPVLSDATIYNPTFTGIAGEWYQWQVTVNDGNGGIASDTVLIVMEGANRPPIANAGPDQNNASDGTITLDGSGSYDPDGDTITYSWQQTNGSGAVVLSDSTAVNPTFAGIAGEWYIFELTVQDTAGLTDTDTVVITMEDANRAPIADAGPDQNNAQAGNIQLDGTGSYDPDGDTLTYQWNQVGGSATGVLNDPTVATPMFTGELGEYYIFELTVSDGNGGTDTDTVVIDMVELTNLIITTSSKTMNLYRGEVTGFRAYALYSDGTSESVTKQAQFISSNTGVASIISFNTYKSGLTTALLPGSTQISAVYNGLISNTYDLHVMTPTVDHIDIVSVGEDGVPSNIQPLDLPANIKWNMNAYVTYSDGAVRHATNGVTWASSNSGNVSIRNNVYHQGEIITHNPSTTADITATLNGVTSNPYQITVNSSNPVSLTLNYSFPRADNTLSVGQSMNFTAVATYDDGNSYDVTDTVTWTSNSPSVLSIRNNRYFEGRATANSTGSATITATLGGLSQSTTPINVNSFTLTALSIALDPVMDLNNTSPSVPVGVPRIYRAIGTYSDSTTTDVTEFVTWHSNNPYISEILNYRYQEGYVLSHHPGNAVVFAEANGVSSNSLGTSVLDESPISITINTPATIHVGPTGQAHAIATFPSGTYETTRGTLWTTDNPLALIVTNKKKEEGQMYGLDGKHYGSIYIKRHSPK